MIVFIASNIACSKVPYNSFACAEVVIPQPVKHTKHLIVVSSPQCGYCKRALTAIVKDSLTQVVDITFVEFFRIDDDYSKFSNIEVRKGDGKCGSKHEVFFPVFYLYDRESAKLIYKQKGFPADTIKKLRKKL